MQRILGFLLFYLGAPLALSWHVWVYFGISFAAALLSLGIMVRVNPETLRERGKVATDSPVWDKWLLGMYWLLHFFVIHFVAGLEWQGTVSNPLLYWLGMLFVVLSIGLALAALVVNTYLESTARIQADRKQKVVTTGVYRLVRHPTYLAVLLSALGIALVFATPYVACIAALIGVIIVIRTSLEDQMLHKGLAGYGDYAKEVRYRLIPGLW